MRDEQILKVMLDMTDMPAHKLTYAINQTELVRGIWDGLAHYGIEHTYANHQILVDVVQAKLDGPDIEREWTAREYETFVKFDTHAL